MATLVVSDLHLGVHSGGDVVRDPAQRARLLAALPGVDRLVLLGDLLELRHGPVRDALAVAREPLSEIGAALDPGAEVILLAGNHDHDLIDPWLERRGRRAVPPPLSVTGAPDFRRGEPLAAVAGWLGAERVRIAYPGVWLRDDVFATHGHYLDVHLAIPSIERLATGVMRRIVALGPDGPTSVDDYEAILTPIYAWIRALAERTPPERGGHLHTGSTRGWAALTGDGAGLRRRLVAGGYPVAIAALNRAGLGPLRRELSGPALMRAGLRGVEEALARTGVDAPQVIFGHTHRAGPLPEDDPRDWRTVTGGRLYNTGNWVHEPGFLGRDPSRSPYRPGFAVRVGASGPPELVNLLDG